MSAQPSRTQVQAKLARLVQAGFVPILLDNAVDPLLVCEVAHEAGLPAVEYTLLRRDYEMLPIMKREFGDLLLLVGSVIDQPEVVRFVQSRRPFHSVEQLYDLGGGRHCQLPAVSRADVPAAGRQDAACAGRGDRSGGIRAACDGGGPDQDPRHGTESDRCHGGRHAVHAADSRDRRCA